jgi:hypothetical protein
MEKNKAEEYLKDCSNCAVNYPTKMQVVSTTDALEALKLQREQTIDECLNELKKHSQDSQFTSVKIGLGSSIRLIESLKDKGE